MNLINLLAILLVVAVAVFIVIKILTARKNQEVEEEVELDDKFFESPTEENDNQLNKAIETLIK